jgi:hypothetical protein
MIFAKTIDSAKYRKMQKIKNLLKAYTDPPLILKKGIYYDTEGNPFCPACRADVPPHNAPLQEFHGYDRKSNELHCPRCDKYYSDPFPK